MYEYVTRTLPCWSPACRRLHCANESTESIPWANSLPGAWGETFKPLCRGSSLCKQGGPYGGLPSLSLPLFNPCERVSLPALSEGCEKRARERAEPLLGLRWHGHSGLLAYEPLAEQGTDPGGESEGPSNLSSRAAHGRHSAAHGRHRAGCGRARFRLVCRVRQCHEAHADRKESERAEADRGARYHGAHCP